MSFEIIPAIDLSEGRVVQLRQGLMDEKMVFGDDPAAAARRWSQAGAPRLHVIDLDATVNGAPPARDAVRAILDEATMPVQLGGGVRTLEAAREWLSVGVDRVILGTAAVADDSLRRRAIDELGEHLVIALDFRGRDVKVDGWKSGAGRDLLDTARTLADEGAARILCTDIARDGMLQGPNLDALAEVASVGVPVIASGGVSSVDDLRALCTIHGVEGAIIGTALYTGDVRIEEALAAVGAG